MVTPPPSWYITLFIVLVLYVIGFWRSDENQKNTQPPVETG